MNASSPPPPSDGSVRASPSAAARLHAWGKLNPKIYYIFPPSAWAVFVYVTSVADLREAEEVGRSFPWLDWILAAPGFDKAVHAVYYAVLSLLIVRGWQREKMPPLDLHGFVFLMCVVFGGMIEVHQSLLPYRSFEALDLLADAAGALAGQTVWHLAMLRWGKRTRLYPGLLRPGYRDSPANSANRGKRKRAAEGGDGERDRAGD